MQEKGIRYIIFDNAHARTKVITV